MTPAVHAAAPGCSFVCDSNGANDPNESYCGPNYVCSRYEDADSTARRPARTNGFPWRQRGDMKSLLLATVTLLFFVTAAIEFDAPRVLAQSPGAVAGPAFEVASVKRNTSGDGRVGMGMAPGGQITMVNVPLRQIILRAYEVQNFQLIGGPGWITSDRFDVTAKADGNVTPSQVNLMLRSLLADRFKLVVHNESREMPLYELVMARPDGKPGPNLTPSAVDCTAARGRRTGGPPAAGAPPAGQPPGGPAQPGALANCQVMMGISTLDAKGQPLSLLATTLSPRVGRIVVDKTGLTGGFDFTLQWTPEPGGPGGPAGVPPPGAPAFPPVDPNGPSIFTALQEQLGLKLDTQRGPIDVVVIDSVAQPTED
jgi:uncharacterized protein (TIGR03435 family)